MVGETSNPRSRSRSPNTINMESEDPKPDFEKHQGNVMRYLAMKNKFHFMPATKGRYEPKKMNEELPVRDETGQPRLNPDDNLRNHFAKFKTEQSPRASPGSKETHILQSSLKFDRVNTHGTGADSSNNRELQIQSVFSYHINPKTDKINVSDPNKESFHSNSNINRKSKHIIGSKQIKMVNTSAEGLKPEQFGVLINTKSPSPKETTAKNTSKEILDLKTGTSKSPEVQRPNKKKTIKEAEIKKNKPYSLGLAMSQDGNMQNPSRQEGELILQSELIQRNRSASKDQEMEAATSVGRVDNKGQRKPSRISQEGQPKLNLNQKPASGMDHSHKLKEFSSSNKLKLLEGFKNLAKSNKTNWRSFKQEDQTLNSPTNNRLKDLNSSSKVQERQTDNPLKPEPSLSSPLLNKQRPRSTVGGSKLLAQTSPKLASQQLDFMNSSSRLKNVLLAFSNSLGGKSPRTLQSQFGELKANPGLSSIAARGQAKPSRKH